jgi:hypothetical protein
MSNPANNLILISDISIYLSSLSLGTMIKLKRIFAGALLFLSLKPVYIFIPVACLNIIWYDAIFHSWNLRGTLI